MKVKATYVDKSNPEYDDITLDQTYDCLGISPYGNAKIIDDSYEENYLLSGEFEIIEE